MVGDLLEKLRVLVVDDSSLYKKVMVQAVENTGLARVEHTASNGILALERLKQCKADVVLLKVFMPEINGIETLKIVKRDYPEISVIMVSSGGGDSAADTIKALEMGAMDFVLKPSGISAEKSVINLKNQLRGLFTQIATRRYTSGITCQFSQAVPARTEAPRPAPADRPGKRVVGADLVVIASSTGGPVALETICAKLPAGFDRPILVVQHMPPEFTKKLAQWLDKKCQLPVVEAADGDKVAPGRIMIAPGGVHMTVARRGAESFIGLENTPPVNGVRPAADVLFRSVAGAWRGKRVLAVILTGMGSDGTEGVREMKRACDCYCMVQSEKTCVVYGMPQSAVNAGLADDVQGLGDIPAHIQKIVSGRS